MDIEWETVYKKWDTGWIRKHDMEKEGETEWIRREKKEELEGRNRMD